LSSKILCDSSLLSIIDMVGIQCLSMTGSNSSHQHLSTGLVVMVVYEDGSVEPRWQFPSTTLMCGSQLAVNSGGWHYGELPIGWPVTHGVLFYCQDLPSAVTTNLQPEGHLVFDDFIIHIVEYCAIRTT
jgi:hypothetical protein